MDGWTVINTNADEYKWAYDADKDGAVLPQNKKLAADDWIITPEINLIGGVTYRIKSCIQSLTTYSFDRQYYNITIGSAPTAEAQTTQVYKDESFTKTAWPVERPEGDKAGLFTPEADGTYYIGFHCYSKSYMGDFLFQKFTVEEVLPLPGSGNGIDSHCRRQRRTGSEPLLDMACGELQRSRTNRTPGRCEALP